MAFSMKENKKAAKQLSRALQEAHKAKALLAQVQLDASVKEVNEAITLMQKAFFGSGLHSLVQ